MAEIESDDRQTPTTNEGRREEDRESEEERDEQRERSKKIDC